MDNNNDLVDVPILDATEELNAPSAEETSTDTSFKPFEFEGRTYNNLDEWQKHFKDMETGFHKVNEENARLKEQFNAQLDQSLQPQAPVTPIAEGGIDPELQIVSERLRKETNLLDKDDAEKLFKTFRQEEELESFVQSKNAEATKKKNDALKLTEEERSSLKRLMVDGHIPMEQAYKALKADALIAQATQEAKNFSPTGSNVGGSLFEVDDNIGGLEDKDYTLDNLHNVMKASGLI